jgi:hypothetical protein
MSQWPCVICTRPRISPTGAQIRYGDDDEPDSGERMQRHHNVVDAARIDDAIAALDLQLSEDEIAALERPHRPRPAALSLWK